MVGSIWSYEVLLENTQKDDFTIKINLASPVFTHTFAYQCFNRFKLLLTPYLYFKFHKDWPKMKRLLPEKAISQLKSVRCDLWSSMHPHFNGLRFVLISTHIWSFIKIGCKISKLSSEKAIFRLKSVRRDPWSPMHINILLDSNLGYHLCISRRSWGTIKLILIPTPHSKFHKDWSRNAQVIACKHQTLMTEWKIGTWVIQLPWGLLNKECIVTRHLK